MKKKVLLSVMIMAALVAVTGCGKKDNNSGETTTAAPIIKKLNCTIDKKEKKYTENVRYIFNFKNDVFDRISVITTDKYNSGKYDEKTATTLEKKCTEALKNKGVTCNISKSGSSIYTTYQFTVEQLDEESTKLYKEFGFDNYTGKSIEEIKAALVEASFTCN